MNYLRSTVSQTHLTSLVILTIERDALQDINYNHV